MDDYAQLGIGTAVSVIVDAIDDGQNLSFICVYDPQGSESKYRLCFNGTCNVQWEGVRQFPADLIGISLGLGDYGEPAVVTADKFEVEFLYKLVTVHAI